MSAKRNLSLRDLTPEQKHARQLQQMIEWRRRNRQRCNEHNRRCIGKLDESKALPRLRRDLSGLSPEEKRQEQVQKTREWKARNPERVAEYKMRYAARRRRPPPEPAATAAPIAELLSRGRCETG